MNVAVNSKQEYTPSVVYGVTAAAAPLAYARLMQKFDKQQFIHIAPDDKRASALAEALPFFVPEAKVAYFPAWDVLPYDRSSPNPAIVTERLEALAAIMQVADEPLIVVTTASAFMQYLPPKTVLSIHLQHVQKGSELNRDAFGTWLMEHGYTANSKAVESGEYALRGSIIDVVPAGMDVGYRIDLFGDEIEQIKQFDPLTQRSHQEVENFTLLPASEVLLTKEHIEIFRRQYREAFGAVSKHDPLYEAISSGARYVGMEHWLPLFYEHVERLSDYLPGAAVVMDQDAPEAFDARAEYVNEGFEARMHVLRQKYSEEAIYHPLPAKRFYMLDDASRYPGAPPYLLSGFKAPDGAAAIAGEFEPVHWSAVSNSTGHEHPLVTFKKWRSKEAQKNKAVIICSYSVGSRERLLDMLAAQDIKAERLEQLQPLPPGSVAVAAVPILGGFATDAAIFISEEQLLGERLIRTRRKKRDADYFMAEAATFEPGELIVHKEHGIGRFDSLETIRAGDAVHDCLKIFYADDDRLFVPVENIDVLSRYGSDSEEAQLDKLGAASWQSRKARMKQRVKDIAEALMKTAAERMLKPGEIMQAASSAYQEFAARFGHIETEDQERSIEAVEQDLLSGKPMDRLICGDVGFGKTEVALRAAFVACSSNASPTPLAGGDQGGGSLISEGFSKNNEHLASGESPPLAPPASGVGINEDVGGGAGNSMPDGRAQVALIVPTTLLARQHYQNFKARFAGFDVKVAQLSRLVSAKEAAKVKEGLADGTVDIVIGTHALLSKDIKFKRLGLVIVDEEQRFGVVQKEKLKALKADVHVLTLTATPIPRTLQLSLSGVRDLSLITTPPVDRLAVRTFVMPFDPVVLREALMREKNRDGGTFIVTPRIQDIGELKAKIKELTPELNVEVAHGQMAANDLDELMNRFYDRKIDVLIATTIIESGLDIPHANTIIINRADRFGLAQLYQLRGRVGRSKTRAYAYLLLPKGGQLTKEATKRLEVMQTLDRLGAGFTLASHDMDIRGFGNLVGDEQSGHIKEVGVELYQQMLSEAIEKVKQNVLSPTGGELERGQVGQRSEPYAPLPASSLLGEEQGDLSPQINLGMSVLIPEHYVEDLNLRMGLYRRIGLASDEAEIESLAAEMIDRFGPLPDEVKALLATIRIKIICKKLYISKLDAGPKGMVLNFAPLGEARAGKLVSFLGKYPTKVKMRPDQSVFVSDSYNDEVDKIRKITAFLEDAKQKLV